MARTASPDLPPPTEDQVAFAEQIKLTLQAIASAVAPIPEGSLSAEELAMAEAGLVLVVDALSQLGELRRMFLERRDQYFVLLYANGRTHQAIGELAGGLSDVLVGKVLRRAREEAGS